MALCSSHNIVHSYNISCVCCQISVANISCGCTSSLLSLQANGQTPLQRLPIAVSLSLHVAPVEWLSGSLLQTTINFLRLKYCRTKLARAAVIFLYFPPCLFTTSQRKRRVLLWWWWAAV